MQKFFYHLRLDIEKNKQYPKKAKRFRQSGKVHVAFEISKSGEILNIQLKNVSEIASFFPKSSDPH